MHELLLHATIPSFQHDQVLSILTGIAAMQPMPILEKHLIYKPTKALPTSLRPNLNAPTQPEHMKNVRSQTHGELFYLKLIADIKDDNDSAPRNGNQNANNDGDVVMADNEASQPVPTATISPTHSSPWTLHFRDLPDPSGRRPVTSRAMLDTPLTSGDALKFLAAMDYTHISSSLLRGHRLTHNNILLLLFQPLSLPGPNSINPSNLQAEDLSRRPNLAAAQLVDKSGGYVLQASVRVQDGQKMERMQQGTAELLALREMLRGVVELAVVERGDLDPRVR